MMTIIVTILCSLIGFVIGFVVNNAYIKKEKETAELTLLNAEQETVNLRGQAERDAYHIRQTAGVKAKELLVEAKEEARRYREEIVQEFKSDRQELKQMETRLSDRSQLVAEKFPEIEEK